MQVSPELNEAAQGVDLVCLEGMGRGIETNLNAEFTCDALNLGMVKHPEVAYCPGAMYIVPVSKQHLHRCQMPTAEVLGSASD